MRVTIYLRDKLYFTDHCDYAKAKEFIEKRIRQDHPRCYVTFNASVVVDSRTELDLYDVHHSDTHELLTFYSIKVEWEKFK